MQILLTSANAQDLLLLVFHFNNTDNYIRTEPEKKRRTPQMDLETFLFNRKQLNFHKMFRIRRLVFVVFSRYTLNECMGNFWLYMFEWARVVYIYEFIWFDVPFQIHLYVLLIFILNFIFLHPLEEFRWSFRCVFFASFICIFYFSLAQTACI